jgi:hypothetical protein
MAKTVATEFDSKQQAQLSEILDQCIEHLKNAHEEISQQEAEYEQTRQEIEAIIGRFPKRRLDVEQIIRSGSSADFAG